MLLEKGVLSRDESIYGNNDTLVTELHAFNKLANEHRAVHFCLLLVHIVLIVFTAAHTVLVFKQLRLESKACILFHPAAYCLLLAFCLIVLTTSVLSIRHVNRKHVHAWFFATVKKAYFVLSLISLLMVVALFASHAACHNSLNVTVFTVGITLYSLLVSTALLFYTSWFIRELKELGYLNENDAPSETSGRKEVEVQGKVLRDELPGEFARRRVLDDSNASVTTV